MKKLLAAVLVICVAFAGFLTWKNYTPKVADEPETLSEVSAGTIDLDAIYALHAPDEVVMTVGGDSITWEEYYYYLTSNISYVSNQLSYFGPVDWTLPVDEAGLVTVSDAVNEMSADNLQQLYCVVRFAESKGADLTAEQQSELDEYISASAVSCCGEGATEEDFNAYLKKMRIPRSLFDLNMRWGYLDDNCFTQLYGEDGAAVSDEDAMAYIEKNGYVRANHILFMCIDTATGESLDEAVKAEKLAQAQALVEELRACESNEELLALYAQRKEELDEDTGKTAYPDGYIFNESTSFVQEFKTAGAALKEYEVSDPVESAYGYHVMLRLPITPDDVVDTSTGYTARLSCAVDGYNEQVMAYIDSCPIQYAPGFEKVNIQDFVR